MSALAIGVAFAAAAILLLMLPVLAPWFWGVVIVAAIVADDVARSCPSSRPRPRPLLLIAVTSSCYLDLGFDNEIVANTAVVLWLLTRRAKQHRQDPRGSRSLLDGPRHSGEGGHRQGFRGGQEGRGEKGAGNRNLPAVQCSILVACFFEHRVLP